MDTKICNVCGEEKPLTEFNFRNKREGLYMAQCKECLHKRRRELYRTRYKDRYKHRLKLNKEKHRSLIRDIIANFKLKHKCCICGESDPCCLDFHHIRDKKFEIGHSADVTVKNLLSEMEKCIILCSNCHRKVHAGKIAQSELTNVRFGGRATNTETTVNTQA